MVDNWDRVKSELSGIGPVAAARALEPGVLRHWFVTLLISTDNKQRRSIEKALIQLSNESRAVDVITDIIEHDVDANVRCYAATLLANYTTSFVDAILKSEASEAKLESLGRVLSYGLLDQEIPNNLRMMLLKGCGTFACKTFPDILPETVEMILRNEFKSCYVFELLASFAKSSKEFGDGYTARMHRESSMWEKFIHLIVPYTINVLDSPQLDKFTVEKISVMVQEWVRLEEPELVYIRSIVEKIFQRGIFTLKVVTNLISGFYDVDARSKSISYFVCTALIENVHEPLIQTVYNSVSAIDSNQQTEHVDDLVELVHVILEYYSRFLERNVRSALSIDATGQPPELPAILSGICELNSNLTLMNPSSLNDFTDVVGLFYSRLFQALSDEYFKVDHTVGNLILHHCNIAFQNALQKSVLTDNIEQDSDEHERILHYRECYSDFVELVDYLAEALSVPPFSVAFAFELTNCIQKKEIAKAGALLFYLNPVYSSHLAVMPQIDNLADLCTLLREETNVSTIQRIDCVESFIPFMNNILVDEKVRPHYKMAIECAIDMAVHFIGRGVCLETCFTFIATFVQTEQLSDNICYQIHLISLPYVTSNVESIRNSALACISNCCGCSDPNTKERSLKFIEEQCFTAIGICCALNDQHPIPSEVQLQLVAKIQIISTYCSSMTKVIRATVSAHLANSLWTLIKRLMDKRIPQDMMQPLCIPFAEVIYKEIFDDLASEMPKFVVSYPELMSRVLKEALNNSDDFVMQAVMPFLFNYVTSAFSVTIGSEEVRSSDMSTLELLYHFLRGKSLLLAKYVSTLSSMASVQSFMNASAGIALKVVAHSFTDLGISRGLRVIEALVTIKNNELLTCLDTMFPHIITSMFDLIFTFFCSSAQNSMATILFHMACHNPEEFRRQLAAHKVGTMKNANLFGGRLTRTLILKQIMLWNMEWSKDQTSE